MKHKLLLLHLCIIVAFTAFCQTKIPIDSGISYQGKLVTICTKVYGSKAFDKVTLLNLGAKFPNSLLTIAIF